MVERRKFPPITTFVRQETASKRGKNTCYATSIVNAAIALGALGQDHAELIHQAIVDELVSNPTLWRGSELHISTDDPRIAEIIERYLPVHIGFDSPIGRLATVRRTFKTINQDLLVRYQAHVITVENQHHSYAGVASQGDTIVVIDPLDPKTRLIINEEQFYKRLGSNAQEGVITTPVRHRVKS